MKKKHVTAATLVVLAGLNLGCTNPDSVVDPRTQAGNAAGSESTTSQARTKADATGYWYLESDPITDPLNPKIGHLAIKQLADGTLMGESNIRRDLYPIQGSNSNGQLQVKFIIQSLGTTPSTLTGTISDDGTTVTLTVPGNDEIKYKCTRLF